MRPVSTVTPSGSFRIVSPSNQSDWRSVDGLLPESRKYIAFSWPGLPAQHRADTLRPGADGVSIAVIARFEFDRRQKDAQSQSVGQFWIVVWAERPSKTFLGHGPDAGTQGANQSDAMRLCCSLPVASIVHTWKKVPIAATPGGFTEKQFNLGR